MHTPVTIINSLNIQFDSIALEAAIREDKKPRNTMIARLLYLDLTAVFWTAS